MGAGHQALLMVNSFGGGGAVSLAGSYGIFAYRIFPNQARARIVLGADGSISRIRNTDAALPAGMWLNSGDSSDYEAMFHATSGNLSAGAEDTWQSLSSNLPYEVNSTSGTVECIGTLSIRDTDTSTVQATTTLYLTADSS